MADRQPRGIFPKGGRFHGAPGKVYVSTGEGEEVPFGEWVPVIRGWVTKFGDDSRRTQHGVVTLVDHEARFYTVTYVERTRELTRQEQAYVAGARIG